jgi:hypothetical protein
VFWGVFWGRSGLFWDCFRVLDARFASRDAVKATLGSFSCWIQWRPSQCPETRERSAKYRSSRTRYLNYGSSRARNRPTRSGRKRARNGARAENARRGRRRKRVSATPERRVSTKTRSAAPYLYYYSVGNSPGSVLGIDFGTCFWAPEVTKFWGCSRVVLGLFWGCSGAVPGLFWACSGGALGSF